MYKVGDDITVVKQGRIKKIIQDSIGTTYQIVDGSGQFVYSEVINPESIEYSEVPHGITATN